MKKNGLFVTAALAAVLIFVPAALGKGPGGGAGSSSSLSLVLMNSTDGLPHHGQDVTFNVSTTATQPFVRLDCYQNGVWVYTSTVGYFPSYPWEQYFALTSGDWTSGAADCTATLYSVSSKTQKESDLGSLSFHVYA
jgi:hypothetical protein